MAGVPQSGRKVAFKETQVEMEHRIFRSGAKVASVKKCLTKAKNHLDYKSHFLGGNVCYKT